MSFFYEIRSADNTVLKRDSGFPDREAATEAARADAKKLRAVPKPPPGGWPTLWVSLDFPGGRPFVGFEGSGF